MFNTTIQHIDLSQHFLAPRLLVTFHFLHMSPERVAPGVMESQNAVGFFHYIFTGLCVCVFMAFRKKKNHFISPSAVKTVRSHQRQLSEGTTSSIGWAQLISMEAYCLLCPSGRLTFKAIAMLQQGFNLYRLFQHFTELWQTGHFNIDVYVKK